MSYVRPVDATDLIDLTNALAALRSDAATAPAAAIETMSALESRYDFGDTAVLSEFEWCVALTA